MSHQDLKSGQEISGNLADLGKALKWLLSGSLFASVLFRKDSLWNPLTLAAAALLWAWSDEPSLIERFHVARKITRRLFPEQAEPPKSYQAFLKMLKRWGEVLLVLVVGHFRFRMRTALSERFEVAGFVVFGVDGSRVELPRTASNEEGFAPSGTKGKPKRGRRGNARSADKKATSPQIWLTTLWHVGTGLPWDWRSGPSGSSEREHLIEMLAGLPPGSLLTADAGFVGYAYWAAMSEEGHHFVIRVGANVKLLKKLGFVRESAGIVYLWPDRAAAKHLPPLVLRLVVVHNGKHPVYLVTSVLDPKRLSEQQVVAIYKLRWGVEVFYRSFKQTFQRKKLRSLRGDNAQVELDWSLAALWAICLLGQRHHTRLGIEGERLSAAGVLRAIRRPMRESKSDPDPGEDLWTLLSVAVVDRYPRTCKTSRDYPRKKQEKPPGKPKIVRATKRQTRLAKELKETQTPTRLTA